MPKKKILVLMKRFGANKDMVIQNFGRQIRLFDPLAKKYKIHFFCVDYKKKESKTIKRNGIKFIVKPTSFFLIPNLLKSIKDLIKKEKYDLIVGTTDPLIGILGYYYSKKFKIPFMYDVQDNYEIYYAYKIPFVGYLDKISVKNADVVFTVSESLKKYISKSRKKPIYVIENGINLKLFKKVNKKKARKNLKLPLKEKIITYVGAISRYQGAHMMLEAFEKIRKESPHTYLLLSGKIYSDIDINGENIIFEELPKRKDVVMALNASDVALIPNVENSFSKYCFPYKLLEYMAIDIPIVATAIGDVIKILAPFKGSLCKPGSVDDLKDKIEIQLKKGTVDYRKTAMKYTWKNHSKKLDKLISKCL